MAQKEVELSSVERENSKASTADKKAADKINQLQSLIAKQKNTIDEQKGRITHLEKELREQIKEVDASERDKRKQTVVQGGAEAKLNRALEEIEKYKLQLRDAKISETGKNDNIRKDLDRMVEENRKLERQRNELLQAFKKQMKLIDVLKRQKMHIESAKLLAFTEDEFVKTLELGDKL